MAARRDDLRLGFAAVSASASTTIADLVGHSVYVSMELGGHETPTPSAWNQDGMAGRLLCSSLQTRDVAAQMIIAPTRNVKANPTHCD